MFASVLTGCIGGDAETDEGDDVVVEELDDWPTYAVVSAGDLPTCDTTTLGRLYYVEDQAEFQVCKSNGWEVITLGGSSLVFNEEPTINVRITMADDDFILYDGDYTYSTYIGFYWNAIDSDGTIATLGIDYTGDLVTDFTIDPSINNPSMGEYIEHPTVDDYNGMVAIPMEVGVSVHRWEYSPITESCALSVSRELSFVATDDDGATGITTIVVDGFRPNLDYWSTHIPADDVTDAMNLGLISQADSDWLTGVDPNSPCSSAPQPEPEICDEIDNDLDGLIDEDFDTQTDPNHCGACNMACPAGYTCQNGNCLAPNTPPDITGIQVNTATAGAMGVIGDTLVCQYTYTDAEGDADQSTVEWYVDGTLVASGQLSYVIGTNGEVFEGEITCRVLGYDGMDYSMPMEDTWLVENSVPTISTPEISYDGTYFMCDYTFTDADGHSDSSYISWFVNGNLEWSEPAPSMPTNNELNAVSGDEVSCMVDPQDQWQGAGNSEYSEVLIF